MAQTKYAIFQHHEGASLPDGDVGDTSDVWRPLGHGMGSTPQQAARDFFAQATESLQPLGGEHYIAVPVSNIHPLPATVEHQRKLTFG